MLVTAIKTERVSPKKQSLFSFLDPSLLDCPDKSILVITSKIVALGEGRYISKTDGVSDETLAAEAAYYLPREASLYGVPLTIRDNTFVARAGIDASNTDGVYSLLPLDSYKTAREVRAYLIERFNVKNIGVIISDSHSTPLRRGVTGVAIGWSGFIGLKGYENVPDIFGHAFTTHTNVVDALATAAVVAWSRPGSRSCW